MQPEISNNLRIQHNESPQACHPRALWSGRVDSNHRPQRPERCALTRLRYAPITSRFYHTTPSSSKRNHALIDVRSPAGAGSYGVVSTW